MKSKQRPFLYRACAFLAGLALASFSHAAVIQGTGSWPSSTQLGLTDAVGFTMTETGQGHVLVVPYFTAQGGQMSVLHLVNTDEDNGKVIKVRYRGAGNGDTLLDFLVLLSPADVWTAAVVAGQDGLAQLITADHSCTYPKIQNSSPVPFNTARLNPAWTNAVKADHTREGSIEAIVVADISPYVRLSSSERTALYTATKVTYPNIAPPCTPSVLDAGLLTDFTSEAAAASLGFATPRGGVAGSWYIIDVAGSTTFSGAATAFKAVNASGKNARGNFVLFPQSSAQVSQPERYTVDPLLVSAGLAGRVKDASGNLSNLTTAAVINAQSTDLPDLSTPYYLPASAHNAKITAGNLSKLMEVRQLSNQYSRETSISAKTDWVLAMPTKRYSVALDYGQSSENSRVFSVVPPAGVDNQYFYTDNTSVPMQMESPNSAVCSRHQAFGLDRDASGQPLGSIASIGGSPVMPLLCGANQVFTVGDTRPSALYAQVNRQALLYGIFNNGWGYMSLLDLNTGLGLPVFGASFIKLTNPQAQPGISGNYGISWPHIKSK